MWSLRSPAVTAAGTSAAAAITAATSEAGFARLGLVHPDVPSFELGFVELPDRVGDFFRRSHLDKAEAF